MVGGNEIEESNESCTTVGVDINNIHLFFCSVPTNLDYNSNPPMWRWMLHSPSLLILFTSLITGNVCFCFYLILLYLITLFPFILITISHSIPTLSHSPKSQPTEHEFFFDTMDFFLPFQLNICLIELQERLKCLWTFSTDGIESKILNLSGFFPTTRLTKHLRTRSLSVSDNISLSKWLIHRHIT